MEGPHGGDHKRWWLFLDSECILVNLSTNAGSRDFADYLLPVVRSHDRIVAYAIRRNILDPSRNNHVNMTSLLCGPV